MNEEQKKTVEKAEFFSKRWLLIFSIIVLVLLFISAMGENVFPEWKSYRKGYSRILRAKATDDLGKTIAKQFSIRIEQNVIPGLDVIDRCITCHTGVEDPRMVDEAQPYTSHPGNYLKIHTPVDFGCTVCHDGQPFATNKNDAHGANEHWDRPILEKEHLTTSCTRCHDELELYKPDGLVAQAGGDIGPGTGTHLITRGKRLMENNGCLGCHILGDKGGSLGPEITFVGDKTHHEFDFSQLSKKEPHEATYWLTKHFMNPQIVVPDSEMPNWNFSQEDAEALTAYILTKRNPAPGDYVLAGNIGDNTVSGSKMYSNYCSACHGISGEASRVPGISSPSLSNSDAMAVASDSYYRRIISSGRSGTKMPSWKSGAGNLNEEEISSVIDHMRSWEFPGALAKNVDSNLGDPVIGKAYFQGSCSNCHGSQGEGGIGNSLNSSTFLAVASDQFLAETIINGRPGTAMPSWKHLPPEAVSDILAFIRQWQIEAPDYRAVKSAMKSVSRSEGIRIGRTIYSANCASCHGQKGEGGIGIRLNSSNILGIVSDRFLYETIIKGRPSTAMPAWSHLPAEDLGAIILYLRSWQPKRNQQLKTPSRKGIYQLGEIDFKESCAGCHGQNGQGSSGPQLANSFFNDSVSDDLLYHWISRGRDGTPMKGFLTQEQGITPLTSNQIVDIIAYIRYLGKMDEQPLAKAVGGNPTLGEELFTGNCASCHGTKGEGASGPQLNNPSFLNSASDGFLAATMVLGRRNTAMRSMVHSMEGLGQIETDQVQDIIAYLRMWEYPDSSGGHRPIVEMNETVVNMGKELFTMNCIGCHGPNGLGERDGKEFFAPALNNTDFLNAASDGFLMATIAKGRAGTPMRAFGKGAGGISQLTTEEIGNIVSFIRSWNMRNIKNSE